MSLFHKSKTYSLTKDEIVQLFLSHNFEHLIDAMRDGGDYDIDAMREAVEIDAREFASLTNNKIDPKDLVAAFFGKSLN